jgi:hypothetical protein
MKADDIAFLIGHADGIVQTHQLTPIPTHVNPFHGLSEVNDKVNFTQICTAWLKENTKGNSPKQRSFWTNQHKILTSFFFSSDSVQDEPQKVPLQVTPTAQTESATKYRRLSTSPITVPGPPAYSNSAEPKRPKRFPHPNYDHRNTNYKQPPLTDRLSLDDIFDERPKESLSPIHPKKSIMTEHQFDFSPEGFPQELYRVGGANMVREYNQRKEQTSAHKIDDEDNDDSTNSLTIYERAYACFKYASYDGGSMK